jgi:hypothetical protein
MQLTAKEARNLYYREWRKKNKDKVREYQRRYWERKAAQLSKELQSEPERFMPRKSLEP